MSKPFDATLKELVDLRPADWAALVGSAWGLPPPASVEVVESDLSVSSVQADKVLRLPDRLLHFDVQADWDGEFPARVNLYNAIAGVRHRLPVLSVAVLLRPDANAAAVTGRLTQRTPEGQVYRDFFYQVVRAWELPAARLLAGPVGTLPLVFTTDDAQADPQGVFDRFRTRVDAQVPPAEQEQVYTHGFILCGLRFGRSVMVPLFRGVEKMRESTTYQYIIEEGEARGQLLLARRWIREDATDRFGQPSEGQASELAAVADLERLMRMRRRVATAAGWDDLLATP